MWGLTQGRCGLPQKKFSLQGYCEENVGDRSPLLTPILQGRQQRGAQHQVIISPQELLTLRNGWNLSSGILVPVFPSSLPSPQAGCPCSMADEALGPSPIPSGTSGVLLGSLAPGIVWVTHTSAPGDAALGHTGVVEGTAALLLPNNLPARPPSLRPHCLPLV